MKIFNIPQHVVDRFKELGAVRYSHSLYWGHDGFGRRCQKPYTDLIYFWDEHGREVGYWSSINPNRPTIFAPNYRQWGEDAIDAQVFHDIPKVEVIDNG